MGGGKGVGRESEQGSPVRAGWLLEWADMYAVGAPLPLRRHLGIDVDQAEGRNFCAARGRPGCTRPTPFLRVCASPRIYSTSSSASYERDLLLRLATLAATTPSPRKQQPRAWEHVRRFCVRISSSFTSKKWRLRGDGSMLYQIGFCFGRWMIVMGKMGTRWIDLQAWWKLLKKLSLMWFEEFDILDLGVIFCRRFCLTWV